MTFHTFPTRAPSRLAPIRAIGAVGTRPAMPAVLVAVAIGVFTYIPDFLAPRSTTWIAVGGFILIFSGLLMRYRRPRGWPVVAIAFGLFYIICLFGAVRYGTHLDYAETVLSLALVATLTLVVDSFDSLDVQRLMTGIIVVCSVQLAFALAETFLHINAPRGYGTRIGSTFDVNQLVSWTGRAPGTFGHAIPLGTYMMVAVLLVVFQMRSWRPTIRVLLTAAFAFGILLSGTRSALLSGFVAVVVALCSKELTKRHLAWRLAVCLAGLVFGAFVGISQLVSSLGLQGTGSLEHRLAAIYALGKLFGRSVPEILFGSGAGSVPQLFQLGLLQTDNFTAVDNQLVSSFAIGGLIGTVCLVWAISWGFRRVPPGVRPALLGMTLMFFSFDEFDRLSTLVLFVSILGCGSLRRWHSNEAESHLPPTSSAGRSDLPSRSAPTLGTHSKYAVASEGDSGNLSRRSRVSTPGVGQVRKPLPATAPVPSTQERLT